ncbi:DENND6 protein [Vigna unguiculata]|uniref:DENND6 protein n=1 Tax=Vigna unguiculata TaxID=3917 RepID=A0A4D6NNG5_VIGUN|nr:DENND6 protein [Vigna unguiculata]
MVQKPYSVCKFNLSSIYQLQQSGKGGVDSIATCRKLKIDLQAVFHVLSKDMQQLMLSNPERASLLQGNLEPPKLPGRPLIQVAVVSSTSPL